jgi:predicted transporter
MKLWIKHPRSNSYDAMLSVAVYTLGIVLFKYTLNGVVLTLETFTINLGTTDAALVAALLTPTLGAYAARKWKNPIPSSDKKGENNGK